MENSVLQIQALGQSVWIDYIRRGMLLTGELGALVRRGVTGLTSNPTIFEKAIAGSTDYDRVLTELMETGKSPAETFEALAAEDIRGAADILRSVYDHTAGADGLVSLELPPPLADDTQVDFAFIDADKTGYLAYYGELVPRLSPHGLIAVDNVLWSGRVVDDRAGGDADTAALVEFNERVADDDRVEVVLLTVGDGVTLIRRRA